MVALGTDQLRTVEIAAVKDDIAPAIGEVAAGGEFQIVARGIAFIADAVESADLEALEIILHHEVDDTGHRVRTIDRRCTAGHDLDARHQRGRDQVQVDHAVLRRADDAAAVLQHQRAHGAQTAQVDGRRQVARVRLGTLPGHGLRQRIEQLLAFDGDRELDFLFADDVDRAVRFDIGARNARTGDDDRIGRLAIGLLLIRRLILRESRARRCQSEHQCRSALQCRPLNSNPLHDHFELPDMNARLRTSRPPI